MRIYCRQGFSLIELIVIITIIAVLSGFISVNLLRVQHRANITGTLASVLADIAHVRYQAMAGVDAPNVHGILFSTNAYSFYPDNVVTALPVSTRFSSIGFPNSFVVFATGSGEIVDYASSSATITLEEINSGQRRVIYFNALGTVTRIDSL